MSRTRRAVIVLIVCAVAATPARAQNPAPDGWVVLPVDEYRQLRARANPVALPPAPPPVDATLTRVDYELNIGGPTTPGANSDTIAATVGMAVLDVVMTSSPARMSSARRARSSASVPLLTPTP